MRFMPARFTQRELEIEAKRVAADARVATVAPKADGSGLARVALHAAVLGFCHPATGKPLRWQSPLPPDLANLVQRLRQGS